MHRKPSIDGKSLDAFILGAKDEKTKVTEQQNSEMNSIPQKEKEIDLDKLRRRTYYISELYIQAIEQMAFYENMDRYKIVMNALEQYIPTKYVDLAVSSCK